MKRRREQKGTIYRKCGVWYLRYSDFRVIDGQLQRKRLAKQLGPVAEMTKKKASEAAELETPARAATSRMLGRPRRP